MHNGLQGGDIGLTGSKKDIYEGVVAENACATICKATTWVIIKMQPPAPRFYAYRKRGPWIWRCHVDLNVIPSSSWNYLKGFVGNTTP